MGILLGLSSAVLFGVSAICVRIGMRVRPVDNGHFMSVVVNCLLIGLVVLGTDLPAWNWTAVGLLVLAGVMTTFLARGSSFAAIRRIGPSRQSGILVSAPLFAAITGWLILDEGVRPLQAVGAVLVAVGLVVLVRSRMLQEDRAVDRHPRDAQEVEGAPGVEAVVDTQAPALRKSASITGFLFALAAAMLFGVGFVVRKAGLAGYDSAVAGAFIGAMTALGMIIVSAGARRQLDGLVEANFRRVPWWFVAGGVASGFALLAQFKAFDYLPAWVVSLLQGTQAVWTILFSYLFLRDEEDIGWRLLLSIGLVVCGVAVMTLQL